MTLMDVGALAFVLVSGVGCWLARRDCFVLSEIERAVWESACVARQFTERERCHPVPSEVDVTAAHTSPRNHTRAGFRSSASPVFRPPMERDRPLGKRQVRPNLSRSDFGYEERSRTTKAAAKKPKNAGEEDEAGDMGGVSDSARPRGEKDARNLTVEFTKLDMATLKRYKRHYRLKTRQNVTKTELALAVAKHFASQTVDEADTISLFMCARERTDPSRDPRRTAAHAPTRAPRLAGTLRGMRSRSMALARAPRSWMLDVCAGRAHGRGASRGRAGRSGTVRRGTQGALGCARECAVAETDMKSHERVRRCGREFVRLPRRASRGAGRRGGE